MMDPVEKFVDKTGFNRLGFRSKFIFIFYLVVIMATSLVGFYGYRSASSAYRESALQSVAERTKEISSTIDAFLREIPGDLQFISDYYALNRYLYWRDLDVDNKRDRWKAASIDTYRSFLLSKGWYYKLRFIDTKGLEKITIRYLQRTGHILAEGDEMLQDRRHRPYFYETMDLGKDELYVSELNLNLEYGAIEKPYVPVIRFARPVIGDNNVLYGVAVLNIYADTFLNYIPKSTNETGETFYLISSKGDYFVHPQADKAWGHLLGSPANYSNDFPEIYAQMTDREEGTIETGSQVISFRRIYPHPLKSDNFWYMITVLDQGNVMAELNKFVLILGIIFAIVIMIVFLTARFLSSTLMKPLQAVNLQMKSLSKGDPEKIDYLYSADDEIGEMLGFSRRLADNMEILSVQADLIASGNYQERVPVLSDKDKLGNAINNMIEILLKNKESNTRQKWMRSGQGELDDLLRGDLTLEELGNRVLSFLADYLKIQIGTWYIMDDENRLHLTATYAYKSRKNLSNEFGQGEGLVGQAALEKKAIILTDVPKDYISVTSGLGEKEPENIFVLPMIYNNQVKGVMETGSLEGFTELQVAFIEQLSDRLGIMINTIQSRLQVEEMLELTKKQAEDLQSQQEELRVSNEELEEQTQRLQASEEELRSKQDQLENTNRALEERNSDLDRQKNNIESANKDLEKSRSEIELKAEELAIASKYKSEFLANMSHELRTPLNSLLLLASVLKENREGHLSEKEIESVEVIYHSGNDLLSMINDILDLSKIEAGQMELHLETVSLLDFFQKIESNFQHVLRDKKLLLNFNYAPGAPEKIVTDLKRIDQVVKNLISNAIKFTEKGSIAVTIGPVALDTDLSRSGLTAADSLAISIKDTGIGIPPDKQKVIFEAFQQVDTGTSRKFGGTGLGLSISRDFAALLGGEIHLQSEEGKGSEFTLYIPVVLEEMVNNKQNQYPENHNKVHEAAPVIGIPVEDDRDSIGMTDKVILIVEDDSRFSGLLADQSHERGFKYLCVSTGEEGVLFAEKYLPSAIILDIQLPGMSGWQVLKILKEKTETRHIPVHIISVEDTSREAVSRGAIGHLMKPVNSNDLEQVFIRLERTFSRQIKELLITASEDSLRKEIASLVGNGDVHIDEADSGEGAVLRMKEKQYDCLIMSMDLKDINGSDLLRLASAGNKYTMPPVIIYTDRELTWEESTELRKFTRTVIVKGVLSAERLLDEASLFLHRVVNNLPASSQQVIRDLHEDEKIFEGKRILIVDDDMRNTFALANLLEGKGIEPLKAGNGKKCLEMLKKETKIDLVLMDIMMPVMDGFETIKRIRKQKKFKGLPIIALTAKAMKKDREECLAAGASDYLAKPVNEKALFSLLRILLYK